MSKDEAKHITVQFRQYATDPNFPVFAFWEGNWPIDRIAGTGADGSIRYMHFHNCVEIGYCLRGGGDLFVEDRRCEYTRGDLILVLPYTTHIARPFNQDEEESYCEYLYIDTSALLKRFYPDGSPSLSILEWNSAEMSGVIRGAEHPELLRIVTEILSELRAKGVNYQDCVKGLALSLLARMARVVSGKELCAAREPRSVLAVFPAIKFINDAYAERISVERLAELCFLSPTHFRRVFKAIMGCSPLEYIHQLRVNRACERLYATNDSILSISFAVGFDSVSSFNRQFAQIMGVAPSVWRRKNQAGRDDAVSVRPYDPTQG